MPIISSFNGLSAADTRNYLNTLGVSVDSGAAYSVSNNSSYGTGTNRVLKFSTANTTTTKGNTLVASGTISGTGYLDIVGVGGGGSSGTCTSASVANRARASGGGAGGEVYYVQNIFINKGAYYEVYCGNGGSAPATSGLDGYTGGDTVFLIYEDNTKNAILYRYTFDGGGGGGAGLGQSGTLAAFNYGLPGGGGSGGTGVRHSGTPVSYTSSSFVYGTTSMYNPIFTDGYRIDYSYLGYIPQSRYGGHAWIHSSYAISSGGGGSSVSPGVYNASYSNAIPNIGYAMPTSNSLSLWNSSLEVIFGRGGEGAGTNIGNGTSGGGFGGGGGGKYLTGTATGPFTGSAGTGGALWIRFWISGFSNIN